jgi:CDP-glycerol glycerophosphotransferase (TagB/SpsB family)
MTHKKIVPTREPIIPDEQSYLNVERDYADEAAADKYRLMQADTLLRLTKASSIQELEEMVGSKAIRDLINEHNEKMKAAQKRHSA